MGKQHTSIEINGKRYDARTGKLLSGGASAAVPAPKTASARPTAPARHPHQTVQRSQTLMRHIVKKPKPQVTMKPAAKAAPDVARPQQSAVRQHPLKSGVDPARVARAQSVKRSELVRKFSDFSASPSGTHQLHKPVTARIEKLPVAPAPALSHPAVRPQQRSSADSLIEKGLRNAQSHSEPAQPAISAKRKSRFGRLASAGAGGMAVLLLGAFILYQNVPNISMRYAAQRAGIAAQLPDYQPSGFALSSKIKYTPGQIEMNFTSNTDERAFTITQRESSWNSDTLMSNYVAQAGDQVQTYEDRGRTIYLYGDSNATWVNAGVWYDIQGNSQLNSDQLIRIATSM